jgi:kynurenine formamidase
MRIIDLTLPMYSGMAVFPGDPEVVIEPAQTYARDGWNMHRLHINTHDGTHVNVPIHSAAKGKSLDDYTLGEFCGAAEIYEPSRTMTSSVGVLFRDRNIDHRIAKTIKTARPRFVGLSSTFEFDTNIERELLEAGIISYERLCNLEMLPKRFQFFGMPLKIRGGDGSPVRAFAILD